MKVDVNTLRRIIREELVLLREAEDGMWKAYVTTGKDEVPGLNKGDRGTSVLVYQKYDGDKHRIVVMDDPKILSHPQVKGLAHAAEYGRSGEGFYMTNDAIKSALRIDTRYV